MVVFYLLVSEQSQLSSPDFDFVVLMVMICCACVQKGKPLPTSMQTVLWVSLRGVSLTGLCSYPLFLLSVRFLTLILLVCRCHVHCRPRRVRQQHWRCLSEGASPYNLRAGLCSLAVLASLRHLCWLAYCSLFSHP